MTTDAAFYDRAVRRIRIFMLAIGAAGTAAACFSKGWTWALGFLAGAVASLVNFQWLHQLTSSLGASGRRPPKRLVVFFSLRYLLLGACGYVIVKFFGLKLTAALIGLFVAVAAVIFEALYELIYARA